MERGHANRSLVALGTGKGACMTEHLQTHFPGLRITSFRITSPDDRKYNCIAWAANDVNDWWWPEAKVQDAVWPGAAGREVTLSAFTAAFSTLGYVVGG